MNFDEFLCLSAINEMVDTKREVKLTRAIKMLLAKF